MNAGYVYYWNFSASVEVGTYGEGAVEGHLMTRPAQSHESSVDAGHNKLKQQARFSAF